MSGPAQDEDLLDFGEEDEQPALAATADAVTVEPQSATTVSVSQQASPEALTAAADIELRDAQGFYDICALQQRIDAVQRGEFSLSAWQQHLEQELARVLSLSHEVNEGRRQIARLQLAAEQAAQARAELRRQLAAAASDAEAAAELVKQYKQQAGMAPSTTDGVASDGVNRKLLEQSKQLKAALAHVGQLTEEAAVLSDSLLKAQQTTADQRRQLARQAAQLMELEQQEQEKQQLQATVTNLQSKVEHYKSRLDEVLIHQGALQSASPSKHAQRADSNQQQRSKYQGGRSDERSNGQRQKKHRS